MPAFCTGAYRKTTARFFVPSLSSFFVHFLDMQHALANLALSATCVVRRRERLARIDCIFSHGGADDTRTGLPSPYCAVGRGGLFFGCFATCSPGLAQRCVSGRVGFSFFLSFFPLSPGIRHRHTTVAALSTRHCAEALRGAIMLLSVLVPVDQRHTLFNGDTNPLFSPESPFCYRAAGYVHVSNLRLNRRPTLPRFPNRAAKYFPSWSANRRGRGRGRRQYPALTQKSHESIPRGSTFCRFIVKKRCDGLRARLPAQLGVVEEQGSQIARNCLVLVFLACALRLCRCLN